MYDGVTISVAPGETAVVVGTETVAVEQPSGTGTGTGGGVGGFIISGLGGSGGGSGTAAGYTGPVATGEAGRLGIGRGRLVLGYIGVGVLGL